MSNYPDLSSLDIDLATDSLLSEMFVVRESTPELWENSIPAPKTNIELLDGSWANVWGEGPPVLLAHGFEGRYSQFAPIIESLLISGFQLIGLEMPGHGRARALRADPLSFSKAIQAVHAEVGAFHAIVGHSQGANAVLHAAAAGVSTDKLVLLAPLISIECCLRRMCALFKLTDEGTSLFLRKITALVSVPPSDFDGLSLVSSLDRATLIFHDRMDRQVPISEAEALAGQMSLARLQVSEGLGHRKLLVNPDVVSQIVNFLAVSGSD